MWVASGEFEAKCKLDSSPGEGGSLLGVNVSRQSAQHLKYSLGFEPMLNLHRNRNDTIRLKQGVVIPENDGNNVM